MNRRGFIAAVAVVFATLASRTSLAPTEIAFVAKPAFALSLADADGNELTSRVALLPDSEMVGVLHRGSYIQARLPTSMTWKGCAEHILVHDADGALVGHIPDRAGSKSSTQTWVVTVDKRDLRA